jgi:glycine cleavage system H protein
VTGVQTCALPISDEGATLEVKGKLGEVESTKSVSDLYAPIAGRVVAVNAALTDSPELVNSDPYGAGWVCEIDPTDPASVDRLLDASAYRQLTEG